MKNLFKLMLLIITVFTLSIACSSDDNASSNDTDDAITGELHAAFVEFDTDETSIYLDGSNVIIEATGNPNHTTVYWGSGHPLYIEEPDVQLTPSIITNFDGSGTLTVSTTPQLANSSTATQLGAIGIAVSGAAIYNDQEGNGALDGAAVSLDYTGGHIGCRL